MILLIFDLLLAALRQLLTAEQSKEKHKHKHKNINTET